MLKSKFENNRQTFDKIYNILNIEAIPSNVLLKNLSDGQKQKLKLLSFLLEDHDLIILDEITNALDKKTVNEIYEF
ncbi:ABC transporter ATP-binding protein [Staphylococcus aureus]|uniref:ABC transporter ATP-binding protein n=1 Tax=Staphylococcus aureus TaxID=1280 RepID=A0A380DSH3_STAAU|nr:ABC transporter ATP-binding protein [Staphylococcus aureus]